MNHQEKQRSPEHLARLATPSQLSTSYLHLTDCYCNDLHSLWVPGRSPLLWEDPIPYNHFLTFLWKCIYPPTSQMRCHLKKIIVLIIFYRYCTFMLDIWVSASWWGKRGESEATWNSFLVTDFFPVMAHSVFVLFSTVIIRLTITNNIHLSHHLDSEVCSAVPGSMVSITASLARLLALSESLQTSMYPIPN